LINLEEYEEFKTYRHRQYVAEALQEVELKKESPDYWLSEDDFLAGLEETIHLDVAPTGAPSAVIALKKSHDLQIYIST
jgi:hypothetical protein